MDPYEQLLLKMYVSNTFLLAQLQFQKAKKAKWAKLMELVNGDFLMNFDRYVKELGTVKTFGVMESLSVDATLLDVESLLLSHRAQLESVMA
jgi:hypothetical protein